MFSGDTLFYRGIGRTDLKGGKYEMCFKERVMCSYEKMRETLARLDKMDPSITVLCGHYENTTIGYESRFH